MKKRIVLLLFPLLLIGCTKDVITEEIFVEQAKFNGYIVEENMTGYENYKYIKNIYYAINQENAYDIQYLILNNDDYAKKFFDINKEELFNLVDKNTYVKSVNKSNYAVYHIENDTSYMLVIRSNNTILYVNAPIYYINEIEEFLQDMELNF